MSYTGVMWDLLCAVSLFLLLNLTAINSIVMERTPSRKPAIIRAKDVIPWSNNSFIQSVIRRTDGKEETKSYIRLIDRKNTTKNSTGTKPRLYAGKLIKWHPNSMILQAIKRSKRKPQQPTSHIRFVDPRKPKSLNVTLPRFTVNQLMPWSANSIMHKVRAIANRPRPKPSRIRLIDPRKPSSNSNKTRPAPRFTHNIIPWKRDSNLFKILHYARYAPPPPPYPIDFPIFYQPATTQQDVLEHFNDYLAKPAKLAAKYLPETLDAARMIGAIAKSSSLLGK